MLRFVEGLGRGAVRGLDEVGYGAALFGESAYWTLLGRSRRQPVRLAEVANQAAQAGIDALPIATLLSITIGVMLAIQSLYSLGLFGAESYAHVGIALSVTREFSPLIIGILVAGRSGSALAARLATMTINQEVDALRAIGVNPVRFLVVPALLAMLVMVPALTVWSMASAIVAAGIYASAVLDVTLGAFLSDVFGMLTAADLAQGLCKSLLFGVLIALIGAVNGLRVTGGAEGVGRATTRSVVHSLLAIVAADMIAAALLTV
ncbi:MAG: MlaE family ABC transporter permease [Alphaproteobacteria bacterium]